MPSILYCVQVAVALLACQAEARPQGCKPNKPGAKAVYFLTNEAVNSVVAVPVAADGTLSGGTTTCTGGKGANSVSAATKEPARPDPLLSQSSLTVVGDKIFAVNAGCNTLSMLSISPDDPTDVKLVGAPVDIPGEFPNTVAASAKNGLVCVATTGAVAGVSCAQFNNKGLGSMDELRPFDLKQSTPPAGPLNTVSQVFWSENQATLFATVKGDPTVNNTGFFSAFNVEKSKGRSRTLARTDTRSSPAGTAVLFGSLPIPGTKNIFATDASFGAAILSVDGNNKASLQASQKIDGQKATCWVTIAAKTKSAFVTDVGVSRIVEMSLDDASIKGELDLTDTGAGGFIDLRAAGGMVYVLAGGNGTSESQVLVLDAKKSGQTKLVQSFGLGALGAGANSQGMAVLE